MVEEHNCKQHLVNCGWYNGIHKCSICSRRFRFNLGIQDWVEDIVKQPTFNGYIISFHCDNCGKNFLVAWSNDRSMPSWWQCPYCQSISADKLYQSKKQEVVLCYVNKISKEYECKQTDCIYNTNTSEQCQMFREPVWEDFGTKRCRDAADAMINFEDTSELFEEILQ